MNYRSPPRGHEHDERRDPFARDAMPVGRYSMINAREMIERPDGTRVALTPRTAEILRANNLPFVEKFAEEEAPTEAPPLETSPKASGRRKGRDA